MIRTRNILFNASLFFNCLLVFLLIVEESVAIPAWLQVAGRMHPLILHFPLVLVILCAVAAISIPARKNTTLSLTNVMDMLLVVTALSAALTSIAGLFLSKETGYDPEALWWHKWSGVGVSLAALGWYYSREWFRKRRAGEISVAAVAVLLVIFAGHQGAVITHGQNFLLAPLLPEKKELNVSVEDAVVYTHMVQPILESKCYSCHNTKKAKGDLVMETEALLLKGGKNGALWDSASVDLGLLMRRVHLPLEEKKHMPPQGKPQLTDEEVTIIEQWIRKGASFSMRVVDLDPADTLRQLAQARFSATDATVYDFEGADADVVRQLNTENRIVTAAALSSPALVVNFFNSQLYRKEHLEELSKVKEQLISLDLARMPVTDADIKVIGEFENLRRLNLSFTSITGTTLMELKKLKYLKSIGLSGTKVTAEVMKRLEDFPQLQTVYAWNTAVSEKDMNRIIAGSKRVRYENGYNGDTTRLKLTVPVLKNDELVLTGPAPLQLKHYINGAEIRYTLDGSEPDSLLSRVYTGKEMIDGNITLRARAFKPGWISSDETTATFFRAKFTPDTVLFLKNPDPGYAPDGKLLTDLAKGELNFRNGNWLAWRKGNMDVLLSFEKKIEASSVMVSALVDLGSYIFPPASIEIWGGDDPTNLRKLGTLKPEQPGKMQPPMLKGYETKFEMTAVKYLRVLAIPVARLPLWHAAKGDQAWIFADEVLVN